MAYSEYPHSATGPGPVCTPKIGLTIWMNNSAGSNSSLIRAAISSASASALLCITAIYIGLPASKCLKKVLYRFFSPTLRDREGNSTVVTMEELRTGQPNQPAETEKSGETHTTRLNKSKPQGQRSQGQKSQDQKTQGQRSQGQRPQGQKSQGKKSQSSRAQGQKPKEQGSQEQSPRKQPNRGQKPENRPARPEAQNAEQGRKPDEKQDKQNLSTNETAGSKPSSRRRRRGRRRPRSGGKPDPSKQGE